jgi:hypothetical protein
MTCVDCGKVFDSNSVNSHNSCVSEAEKYQGKLYAGPKHAEGSGSQGCAPVAAVDQSLIRGPPWVCKMCNVSCSGRDNLVAHHQSKKHVNKAKHLASGSSLSATAASGHADSVASSEAASAIPAGAQSQSKDSAIAQSKSDQKDEKDKKQKKDKKDKKDKQDKKQKKDKKVKKDKKDKKRKHEAQELQGISKPKVR